MIVTPCVHTLFQFCANTLISQRDGTTIGRRERRRCRRRAAAAADASLHAKRTKRSPIRSAAARRRAQTPKQRMRRHRGRACRYVKPGKGRSMLKKPHHLSTSLRSAASPVASHSAAAAVNICCSSACSHASLQLSSAQIVSKLKLHFRSRPHRCTTNTRQWNDHASGQAAAAQHRTHSEADALIMQATACRVSEVTP